MGSVDLKLQYALHNEMTDDLKNWTARPRPERTVLEGSFVRLEPLDAALHGDGLFEAKTGDDADRRFRWLPEYPPNSRSEFQPWLDQAEASEDPLYFTVIDRTSGRIAGRQTLMRIDEANGVIETGHIYWSSLISRRPASTEAFFLFAKYVFDTLGYRRFEWKCNDRNEPSKRAAVRYGMKAEGVFRQLSVVKGENRDTAWFSMIDKEWPEAKRAFERWLAPANFDSNGDQISRLEALRQSDG